MLGGLLLGQGLAIEGEGPLLGLEQLHAALVRLPQLSRLLLLYVLIPAEHVRLRQWRTVKNHTMKDILSR